MSRSCGGDAAAGRAAGLDRLELPAVRDAAADLVDDLAQRDAHRHLDQAGVVDLPGQGEHLGALALLGADAGEPVAAVADDRRDVGERLDVVDERRAAPEARTRPGRAGGAAACRARLRSRRSAPSPRRRRRRRRRARMSTWKLRTACRRMSLAEQPCRSAWRIAVLQAADRQRVLGAARRCSPCVAPTA